MEDLRLLTSGGTYVDDLRVPELVGAAYVTFVRSPVAHAAITGVDTSRAAAHPGVVAVYTAADLAGLPAPQPFRRPGHDRGFFAEPLLAGEKVRFVGEPVAVVLTGTRYAGQDAAALVDVRYERLPAVVGPARALLDDTLLFEEAGTNLADQRDRDTYDDAAFADAEVVVEREVVNHRVACVPMECRATAAAFDGTRLTVWHSTQNAQRCRSTLAESLGLPPDVIRVVVPDVGGGFGAKIGIDRDAIVVAWAAWKSRGAVRWAESRAENLVAMTQGRAQLNHVTIGGRRDGTITAYRLDVVQDAGAYPRTSTLAPVTCTMAPGVYDIPHVQTGYRVVVTNTTPVNKYRGAGRPEATAAIERAVDLFAAEIDMDPAEVRRRNLIAPDAFPFRTRTGARYDSGEYEKALDQALAAAGYPHLRKEQAARRADGCGRVLGIGLCVYVEMTGGGGETGAVAVDADGHATVLTGSSTQGQGHHTAWAMLVAAELGIPMDQVTVVHGDTDLIPKAVGTYSSRSLQLGGSAVHKAATEVREQARQHVADLLGAGVADVVLDTGSGTWHAAGDPGRSVTWAQVVTHAGVERIGADVEFEADRPTFPFGAHVSVVEVDTETGATTVLRHVTVDDAGRILNPVLAEGQRHGGIAQGIAQALFEEVRHDEAGHPLDATLTAYRTVTAADLPDFELEASETPTDVNPLGVKGIGESGTIGATPAVQNAVVDAVAHLGVRHVDMPMTPSRVWAAIEAAGSPVDGTAPTGPQGESEVVMVRPAPGDVRDLPACTENLMTSQERRRVLLRDVDVVIDGGANGGQYAKWLRQCGFGGTIISFEPASDTFAVLSEAARSDDDWHCHHAALGPEDGQVLLHLTRTSLGSSVFRRTDLPSRLWPDDVDVGTELVPMRALRSLWSELGCDGRRVYLKLDVEGAELSVLEGAGPVLDRVALLELELPLVAVHQDAPTLTEMLSFLTERGFSAVALEQNHRGDEATGQMLMVDGIFRRTGGNT
ncbi:FkbM family methyltransferase [Micromonospora sp. NPDC023956]|uniref:FkbM family methyltransferase n=1 Tax=Micromonospora sp. NPDC023956 TaxID=3155722 RepID=UPI0033DF0904